METDNKTATPQPEQKNIKTRLLTLTMAISALAIGLAITFTPQILSPSMAVRDHINRIITPTGHSLATDNYINERSAYKITNTETKHNSATVSVAAFLPLLPVPIQQNDEKNEEINRRIIQNSNPYAIIKTTYTMERKGPGSAWTITSYTKPADPFELSQLSDSQKAKLETTHQPAFLSVFGQARTRILLKPRPTDLIGNLILAYVVGMAWNATLTYQLAATAIGLFIVFIPYTHSIFLLL